MKGLWPLNDSAKCSYSTVVGKIDWNTNGGTAICRHNF